MAFLIWFQSFFGYLILFAALLAAIAWAFVQGGETFSTVVFFVIVVFSIGRGALKSGG